MPPYTQTCFLSSHNPGSPFLPAPAMADPNRYRYAVPSGRRSPVLFNPSRASLPGNLNYNPYGGDLHVMPPPQPPPHPRHDSSMPRSAADYRPPNGTSVPVTTTTYAVRKDREPGSSHSNSISTREHKGHHRSSTFDSAGKRPPIIVTTKHAPSSGDSHPLPSLRPDSPPRGHSRPSDDSVHYSQPASSIQRSRSTTRAPFSATLDNDEYARLRERTGDERLFSSHHGDYRPPRPVPIYPQAPRHNATIDYGDEGYEYTKPSDLARYDLETNRPRRSRHDSFDRNYYRPSVSVTTDLSRPYDQQNDRRSRGPPPTTRGLDKVSRASSGGSGVYEPQQARRPAPVPPPVPLAPTPHRSGAAVPAGPLPERRGSARPRPSSMHQEGLRWEDFYRGREDPLLKKDLRERDRDLFQDESVPTRGFGIRTDVGAPDDYRRDYEPGSRSRDDRRSRREGRPDPAEREPRRRSDEDIEPVRKKDDRRVPRDQRDQRDPRDPRDYDERDFRAARGAARDGTRDGARDEIPPRPRKEVIREKDVVREKDVAPEEEERETSKKDKIKEKVSTGLGIAAASIGLVPAAGPAAGPAAKDKDVARHDDKEEELLPPKHYYRDDAEDSRRRFREPDAPAARDSDRPKPITKGPADSRPLIREGPDTAEPILDRDYRRADGLVEVTSTGSRERSRRYDESHPVEVESRVASSRDHSTSDDDGRGAQRTRRGHASSASFNPNDTAGIMALKSQLAAADDRDDRSTERLPVKEPLPERKPSPSGDPREAGGEAAPVATTATASISGGTAASTGTSGSSREDDSRGRDLVVLDERQVRVVSPPREKEEKRPIKGILKQPSSKFPEDPNPVREGVAPHRDDKSKSNVPPDARWTKINRSLVNPEALSIGKERFEVRDDFVIVLRVLSKEEIQTYAAATAELRGEPLIMFS